VRREVMSLHSRAWSWRLSLLVAALVSGAPLWGQSEAVDLELTGQVAYPQEARAAESESGPLAAPRSSSATFGSLALTVNVDEDFCRSGAIQCPIPGLAPAAGNRSPVSLVLQVLKGVTPQSSLTSPQIEVITLFVPAGGGSLSRATCSNCFQNAGNGVYAIYLNPFGTSTWKSGAYHVQVKVKVGSTFQRALAKIEIPF
jgi:hypothetical protein